MEKNKGSRGQLISRGIIGTTHEEAPINSPPTYEEIGITGKEAVASAREIEMEAEFKLGEILLEMDKNKGGQPMQKSSTGTNREPVEQPPTYEEKHWFQCSTSEEPHSPPTYDEKNLPLPMGKG